MSLFRLRPALKIAVRQAMSSAAPPFAPTDSAGLALWLRAPTTSYITGTTQAVDVDTLSSWLDSVGAKSFAQATAASRPRYCVLETVPTVRFAGGNRTTAIAYANKVFGNNTDFTVSLAFRRAQRNTVLGTLYSECNSAATNALFAIVINTVGSITVQMRDNAGAIVQLAATTRVDDNKIHAVTVTVLSGNVICYIDGNLEFTTNYAATVTGWATATFNRTTLGARTSTTVNTFVMCDIYEVVGYTPSLDASSVARHNTYLVSKYAGAIPSREVCGNSTGSGLYSQAIYRLAANKTYIGHGSTNASAQITVINHGVSPATKLTYVVNEAFIGTDRHDSCAVAFDKNGRILAFYDNHNNNVLWVNKSTNVDDPTSWGTQVDIGPGSMHAYLHAIQTTEGAGSWRIYVFYRDQSVGSWNYRLCDNTDVALASMTWAAPVVLWQPQGAVNVQIYGRPRMCADGNIHFFFGDGDVDGIAGTTDLYHFMYKPSAAKFYKSDGTTEITSPPFDATDATKAYDSSNHGNRHIQFTGDIQTNGGNIYITASTKDPDLTGGRRLVRLTYSGSWALDEILTLTSAQDVAFKPISVDTLYYAESDGVNLQQYSITRSGGVWGSPVALTSSDHFTTVTQGAFRVVDAELGGPIDIGYQWGHYADSTTPYGHLLTYPAVA